MLEIVEVEGVKTAAVGTENRSVRNINLNKPK